jgi:serine/threonine protein kinase
MRQLGRGCEGRTAIYIDLQTARSVVVKRYNTRDGNEMPAQLRAAFTAYTDRWPNEIEANWLLAPVLGQDDNMLVPLEDFFILQPSEDEWVWAMVTPFIEGGTLSHAASRIKKSSKTPDELDKVYRLHLHGLLEALSDLHDLGYCHDDVKSDNILVSSDDTWLLGDLGNVRHVSHPLHQTGSWARRNQWADCRLNDVRRLLKTYVAFLREASVDRDAFDVAFLAQESPWSRLYAEWMPYPVYARDTLALSQRTRSDAQIDFEITVTGPLSCLRRKIDQELTCTRIVTEWRDYWLLRQC